MTTGKFAQRIAAMNAMYRLPAHEKPTLPTDTTDRLRKFKATLLDEVNEIDEIIGAAEGQAPLLQTAVTIADLLGDIVSRAYLDAGCARLVADEVFSSGRCPSAGGY